MWTGTRQDGANRDDDHHHHTEQEPGGQQVLGWIGIAPFSPVLSTLRNKVGVLLRKINLKQFLYIVSTFSLFTEALKIRYFGVWTFCCQLVAGHRFTGIKCCKSYFIIINVM